MHNIVSDLCTISLSLFVEREIHTVYARTRVGRCKMQVLLLYCLVGVVPLKALLCPVSCCRHEGASTHMHFHDANSNSIVY